MDVGTPVRAAGTNGARLDGSHHGPGNGGCCKVGEPAGESFDAAARDGQHEYTDRSLRVKNGVCVVFLNAGEAGERLPLGKSVQFCAYLLFVGALAARLSDG